MRCDVLVIGAGPAGTAAANELKRVGADVRLYDRCEFPRKKPCAGALSPGALALLDYDISGVVRQKVNEIAFSCGLRREVVAKSSFPLIAMTQRSEFDALSVQVSQANGVPLVVSSRLTSVEQDGTGVTVGFSDHVVRCDYLIAADGASSAVRRAIDPACRIRTALAIEANVAADSSAASRVTSRVDFGVVESGYGWVFPKGDHLNVGLYSASPKSTGAVGRKRLLSYVASALGRYELLDVQGFPVGIHASGPCAAKGRVLFCGDAGGFAYAFTGEGIYGAILSGRLAGRAAGSGVDVVQSYRASIARMLRRCQFNRLATPLAYGTMPFSYRLVAGRLARQISRYTPS